jgi:hypothetical protein
MARRYPLGNYGLSIVLFLMFLVTWALQGVAQWQEYVHEALAHGETPSGKDFMPPFWKSTLENWQSEFLQLFTFVTLTTYLIHKGSPESKDGNDEMEKTLERIERKLEKLEK